MPQFKIAGRVLVCLSIAFATTGIAVAQAWPTKPVRVIVSFPPGAPGDVIARLIQPGLQTAWGQTVFIENKPGAGGNIGAAEVARATDAHTLLVGPDTMVTINPHLYRKLASKPREDLQPVSFLASFNQMLACHPTAKVSTLVEFTKQDVRTTYASGGPGSPSHMAMEMLLAAGNIKMTHIPYRGPGPAAQDILAGQVACGFIAAPIILPHVKAGKLTPIAVSGLRRSLALPAIPTVAESGFPDFDATFFEIMMAPATLPAAVVQKIQRDVMVALNNPATKAQLLEMDLRVVANTPNEALSRSALDYAKWGRVARTINLQLD